MVAMVVTAIELSEAIVVDVASVEAAEVRPVLQNTKSAMRLVTMLFTTIAVTLELRRRRKLTWRILIPWSQPRLRITGFLIRGLRIMLFLMLLLSRA